MKFFSPNQFVDKLNVIFDEVKSRISQVLPHAEVDHIGSSSIKNAISKGDLDILVRVEGKDFHKGINALQNLGFKIKEGTLRTKSLCMLTTDEFKEDVAIQLVERGSEFENFLKFRDRLNSNTDLVNKYNELKQESVGLTPEAYRKKKSQFIEDVLSEETTLDLFVWDEGKIEDVRFWCEPDLTLKALQQIKSLFAIDSIEGFVGIEARGFYLAGAASIQYGLPTVMVRKHKAFFEKMPHESIFFTNWKGELESLTVMKNTLPKLSSVLIVDDILDTGASLKATQELLARFDIQIKGAFYLLNSYGEKASEDFGIPIKSLLTRKLFT